MKFEEFKNQTMDRIENILDTGGRYLNPADRQFVSTLLSELEQFQYQAPKDRALMFHPLGGFQRYLIHKVTEVFPKLTSFSIGDDTTRRTVVCFKSKKKDQQLGLQQQNQHPSGSKTLPPNMKPDYSGGPPGRGRAEDGRISAARSRESSRNRKKENDYRSLPKQSKQSGSLSHIPKPLRTKKQSTKRDLMKRSRSLQSSPVRMEEEEQSGRSGRGGRKEQSEKRPARSSSLKPPSRRRERDISAEEDVQPKKGHMKHNVSELSMQRRYQGYKLEGKTVNGDCEDPYSCGDSESDHIRVDAGVLRKDRERSRARHDKSQPKSRQRQQSYESSARSEESDASSDQQRHRHHHREEPEHVKKTYIDSDLDDDDDDPSVETQSLHSHLHGNDDFSDSMENFDSGSDEYPPAYDTVKRTASIKKAERNLDRIKRHDSQRSSSHRDESSSSSSMMSVNRASVSTVKKSPKITRAGRSATMPKALKEPSKKHHQNGHHPHRSHTVKNPPVRSNTTETTAIVERQPRSQTPHEAAPRRKSTGSSARPKVKPQRETLNQKPSKNHATSTDDFLEGSNSTLYLPLPDNNKKSPSKKTKPVEKTKKDKQTASLKPKLTTKKTPTPKSTTKVVAATSPLSTVCDGAAQTDFSGTLSRPRKERNKPEPTAPELTSPPWNHSNQQTPVDFVTAMMQNLGGPPQGTSPYQSPQQPAFNPNVFQQMMQSNQNFPPLPPHLMHQMYLSWIGAYYAGATGTWPPPAPPNFMLPQGQQPHGGANQFDMSSFMGNFPRFPNPSEVRSPHQEEEERKYFDEMYDPPNQSDNFQGFQPTDEDPRSTEDPKYPYSVPDHLSSMSNDSEEIHNYTNPGFSSEPHNQDPVENGHSHETDSSSVVSSNKGEVAVENNPRGGVFIYVKSRSNSRASSIAGTHESADSLNTSDNVPSLVSTPRMSEHSHSSLPSKRKSVKKSPLKNASGSRKKKGPAEDPLNVSHEEMILSLRRAPLATIDDDTDGFASSTTSLNHEEEEEKSSSSRESESEDSQDHDYVMVTTETTPTAEEVVTVVMKEEDATSNKESSSEEEEEGWPEPPPYSAEVKNLEENNSAHSSTHSLADSSHHSESNLSKHSSKNSTLSLHSDASQHSDRSRHSNHSSHSSKSNHSDVSVHSHSSSHSKVSSHSNKSKDSDSSKHSSHHSDSSHKLSHHSSSSKHVSHNSDSHEESDSSHHSNEETHSSHDSDKSDFEDDTQLKKDSNPSLSEGNNEDSDHGYDADQSRVEDKIDPSLANNLVKEMNGDIVVQDAQLDYYNFKPNQDEFKDKKYERFLEVYGFQPDMTDLNITSYLSKYRGLRLSRVDQSHALCILPTTDVARELLDEDFSNFRVRPLAGATTATQQKAKTKLENDEFEAVRATRPKSSSTVAKRMIAGALGGKHRTSANSSASKQHNQDKQSKKNKSEK